VTTTRNRDQIQPRASQLWNLQPGADQRSSPSFMINNQDPLRDFVLQDFDTFDLHFPLEYSVPEVLYQVPHVHLKSTALVHFRTLTFRSLKFPFFLPPRMLSPGFHDLLTRVLPQIDGYESLWLFGLREFQNLLLHFVSECFH
jgi:hypothetical protein